MPLVLTLLQRWVLRERKVSRRRMRLYQSAVVESAVVEKGGRS